MTMNKMINDKKQKGFTLIEIIAVLVLLGILAAVAVPRFLGMQEEARTQTLRGAVAAAQSQAAMAYSEALLRTGIEASAWAALEASTVCNEVSTDGFPSDFNWNTCSATGNTFNITAAAAGQSATGTFTRPN